MKPKSMTAFVARLRWVWLIIDKSLPLITMHTNRLPETEWSMDRFHNFLTWIQSAHGGMKSSRVETSTSKNTFLQGSPLVTTTTIVEFDVFSLKTMILVRRLRRSNAASSMTDEGREDKEESLPPNLIVSRSTVSRVWIKIAPLGSVSMDECSWMSHKYSSISHVNVVGRILLNPSYSLGPRASGWDDDTSTGAVMPSVLMVINMIDQGWNHNRKIPTSHFRTVHIAASFRVGHTDHHAGHSFSNR